jgi:GntR family transcriptional regulator
VAPLFALNADDPLPLYAQLERAIKLAVTTGKLPVGDQLPTVRQLAVDLKINANTVAKVYAELERQGMLVTRRGVGTFIERAPLAPALSPAKRTDQLQRMSERFLAEAAAAGFAPDELLEQIQDLANLNRKEKSHGRR